MEVKPIFEHRLAHSIETAVTMDVGKGAVNEVKSTGGN